MHITITANESNQRLDRFLRKYCKKQLPHITLKDIYQMIRTGKVKVNQRKSKEDTRLQTGDTITFLDTQDLTTSISPSPQKSPHPPKNLLIPSKISQSPVILYQDQHRLAFDKGSHIPMHPGATNSHIISLHHYLIEYTQNRNTQDSTSDSPTFTPSFCYRLDKDTSGIVIAALTYPALQLLNELIRDRKVSKTYHTIVFGTPPATQTITDPLFKGYSKGSGKGQTFINHHKGLEAITHIKTQETKRIPELSSHISLLEVIIQTGRMHQIRAHLAHYDYPILCDLKYGNPALNRLVHKFFKINRQLLHASTYSFYDSIQKKELTISAPLPKDFLSFFPNH